MDDQRYCRLRVIGENLDLTGSPAALRALAGVLEQAGPAVEVAIRNGAVVQERGEGPLVIELRGSPTLHLRGGDDALKDVWAALAAVAAEAPEDGQPAPHRHVDRLVITAEADAADDLGI